MLKSSVQGCVIDIHALVIGACSMDQNIIRDFGEGSQCGTIESVLICSQYIFNRGPSTFKRSLTPAWFQSLRIIMRTLLLTSLFLTAWLAECQAVGQPSVQLGDTIIKGNSLQTSNLEFFRGKCSLILARLAPHPSHFQVFLLPSLQSTTSA
jgi:hypothetical protein